MSWNEKDFLRWSAQSYARLGNDLLVKYDISNGILNPLVVPANHIYLLRSHSFQVYNSAAIAATAQVAIYLGAVVKYVFFEGWLQAVINTYFGQGSYPYPIPCLAGYTFRIVSSSAAVVTQLSLCYTDVDLTVFPAYDPGY